MNKYLIVFIGSILIISCKIKDVSGKPLLELNLEEIYTQKSVMKLAKASGRGNLNSINKLLRSGVSVNAQGNYGIDVLWWPMHEQNINGFIALLEGGANPNHQWNSGGGVLHLAAQLDKEEYLIALLKKGGNPNLINPNGKDTPLHDATSFGRINNIDILIRAGSDLNKQNGLGSTPIMIAADLNRYDIVLDLLKREADYSITNNRNMTLIDIIEDVVITIDKKSVEYEWRLKVVEYLRHKKVEINI